MSDETTETNTKTEDMVPRSRLNEVIAQRDEARGQVTTLQSQVQDMQGKVESYKALSEQVETHKAEAEKYKADLESRENLWGQDRSMLKAGIHDEDVQDLLKLRYGKAPEGTDFNQFLEGEKAKPYVQAILASTSTVATEVVKEGTTEATSTTTTQTTAPITNMDVGGPQTPSPSTMLNDPLSIAKMSPEEFAAHADSIASSGLWGLSVD